jgi:hypothetical protein
MDKGTRGEARLHIDVPPERLYDVVTDVRRMGEWSPECVACDWLEGATGPASVRAFGVGTSTGSLGGRRSPRWSPLRPAASSRS